MHSRVFLQFVDSHPKMICTFGAIGGSCAQAPARAPAIP